MHLENIARVWLEVMSLVSLVGKKYEWKQEAGEERFCRNRLYRTPQELEHKRREAMMTPGFEPT